MRVVERGIERVNKRERERGGWLGGWVGGRVEEQGRGQKCKQEGGVRAVLTLRALLS